MADLINIQNNIPDIPFESITLYKNTPLYTIKKDNLSEEIQLIFILAAVEYSDKHKTMIIKMANDLNLYIDHYSLIICLPQDQEFDWQPVTNVDRPVNLIFFGPGLHILQDSPINQWHTLGKINFINTFPLQELATDKTKAMQYWKCVKQKF